MTSLRFILGDQLTPSISSLDDAAPHKDMIFMCEVFEELTYTDHHQQKLVLILSAMRHFAESLKAFGFQVIYRRIDEPTPVATFDQALEQAVNDYKPDSLIMTEPGEWRIWQKMQQWRGDWSIPVIIRPDHRFFCSIDTFKTWASQRQRLVMAHFYRFMRREQGVLMTDNNQPLGGQWHFDAMNRQSLGDTVSIPPRPGFQPSAITRSVIDWVKTHCSDHVGSLDQFNWPVTRAEALYALNDFIERFLPSFGTYQDAMAQKAPFLFHAKLSACMNLGLLTPREVCEKAESAYHEGHAPINACEGFIRQILGWREFIRGIYWLTMPDYKTFNYFNASRDLPHYYWDADTQMACVREAVTHTLDHAYSHHIQRLMVTGNFALLAGINPQQVCDWYLGVYADAYEWVELPNTLGMALFGDGGVFASKPYAASGQYINRMSNYCKDCFYNPNESTGQRACPFNALYWHFIHRNQAVLSNNQRMRLIYKTLERMKPDKREAVLEHAEALLADYENL